eukprot:scaffold310720_cov36-Tisochrysis_lutea.AAC.2
MEVLSHLEEDAQAILVPVLRKCTPKLLHLTVGGRGAQMKQLATRRVAEQGAASEPPDALAQAAVGY